MQIDKVALEDLPGSPASSNEPRRRNTTMEAEKPRSWPPLSHTRHRGVGNPTVSLILPPDKRR